MASSFPFEFKVLFETWRHAEQAAVIAERRWIEALERSTTSSEEKSLRKAELLAAREAASKMFKRAMESTVPDHHSALFGFSLNRPPNQLGETGTDN